MKKKFSQSLETQLITRYGLDLYNELNDKGVALEYITAWEVLVHLGDHWNRFQSQHHKDMKAFKRRESRGAERWVERRAAFPRHGPPMLSPGTTGPSGVYENKGDRDRSVSPTRESTDGSYSDLFLQRLLQGPKLLSPAHMGFPLWMGQVAGGAAKDILTSKEKQLHEATERKIKAEKGISLILFEYCPPPWKGGKRRELEGHNSFILLAITEHLRKKNKKPSYDLAVKLLKVFRGEAGTCSHTETKNAISRVYKLKKSHKGWKSHLKILSNSIRTSTTAGN